MPLALAGLSASCSEISVKPVAWFELRGLSSARYPIDDDAGSDDACAEPEPGGPAIGSGDARGLLLVAPSAVTLLSVCSGVPGWKPLLTAIASLAALC